MKLKKVLKWSLLIISILLSLSVGAAWYLLDYSLTPGSRGHDIEKAWKETTQAYPELKEWRDSLTHLQALCDTTLQAEDGTKLHAFFVKAARPTRHTAILVHGYTDNAIRMMPLGYMYERNLGYNILLPDLRFAGNSGGDHIQMGWKDRKDLIRWLHVIPSLFGDTATVVVHGIS
ncbi:MAG TPA: alpha/beta hydrolase, partial [Alloprevotella sp.]|nr:alpha/beta hydrolase [Alloprevotella sp.]